MELMKKRAERLFDAIRKSRLSYAELEALTGIAKSSIQRYAAGRTQKIPMQDMRKRSATAFQIYVKSTLQSCQQ